jgi:hypothetical protein
MASYLRFAIAESNEALPALTQLLPCRKRAYARSFDHMRAVSHTRSGNNEPRSLDENRTDSIAMLL